MICLFNNKWSWSYKLSFLCLGLTNRQKRYGAKVSQRINPPNFHSSGNLLSQSSKISLYSISKSTNFIQTHELKKNKNSATELTVTHNKYLQNNGKMTPFLMYLQVLAAFSFALRAKPFGEFWLCCNCCPFSWFGPFGSAGFAPRYCWYNCNEMIVVSS